MIKQETITISNKDYIKSYSDKNFYLKKEGSNVLFPIVYDLIDYSCNYIETDIKIKEEGQ